MGGFLAEGKFENNRRSEFKLRNIITDETKILCDIHSKTAAQKTGPFYFNKEGLEFGEKILKPQNLQNCDFVVIDELGPLELKGKGWSEPAELLLNKPETKSIWIVRKNLVYDIIRRFGINEAFVFDISEDTHTEIADIVTVSL